MFRKLRIRFTVLAMVAILLFMLFISTMVYIFMANSLKAKSEAVLTYAKELILADTYFTPDVFGHGENTEDKEQPLPQKSDRRPEIDPRDQWTHGKDEYRRFDWLLFDSVIAVMYDGDGIITCAVKDRVPDEDFNRYAGESINTLNRGKELEDSGTLSLSDADYRYMKVEANDFSVLLLADRTSDLADLSELIRTLIVVFIIAFIAALVLCIVISGNVVKPIADAWKQQKLFIADASHELKTPLTVISTNMDVVLSNPDETVSSQMKWLSYISDESREMMILVNNMLTLAKIDASAEINRRPPHTVFNLSDTVNEAGLMFESAIIDAGIDFELSVNDDISFTGDEKAIRQVLMILLDNALKNTNEHGKISLSLERIKSDIYIRCRNTGRGIPQSELKNIFKRFYRVDPSRARESGGSGLGLAIADSIVKEHGGIVFAESTEGEYALFTVIFK